VITDARRVLVSTSDLAAYVLSSETSANMRWRAHVGDGSAGQCPAQPHESMSCWPRATRVPRIGAEST